MSKEANPESTICKAQTTIPFPIDKNKKPAKAVFNNCFLVIFTGIPLKRQKIKIKPPARIKRKLASINGGNCATATLLSRYVDPQIT